MNTDQRDSAACRCPSDRDFGYRNQFPPGFASFLEQVDKTDHRCLGKCRTCGSCWSLDENLALGTVIVFKETDPERWKIRDTTPERIELLVESRGGYGEGTCIWAECADRRVAGVVYCARHLHENVGND